MARVSADPAHRRATYQDVLDAPPNLVAEVLFGVLHTHPRPGRPHARAASVLGMNVGSPFDQGVGGPGGWLLLYEPEVHLGEDIVVPDFAGWRRERLPDAGRGAFFTLAPDWCCEVLSRRTAAIDRGEKADIYAREGVPHLWFVDPEARTLEAYRLQVAAWLRIRVWHDDARARVEPFDAIELELARLWVSEESAPAP